MVKLPNSISRPLKWHGGKGAFRGKLSKWIISLMPKHIHYVEPFFGGGQVLFYKDPNNISEVINDINQELMNFWNVLRDINLFEKFKRQVEAVPFSQDMFEWSKTDSYDYVVRAIKFFIKYRQSRQGLGKDFATLSKNRTRRGMNEQVSSWLSAIDGLPEIHKRLRRVLILNKNAIDVISEQDSSNTLYYCDPTYLQETRNTIDCYEHEMTKQEHEQLLRTLAKIQGKFLLSGYDNNLYEQFRIRYDWKKYEFHIVNNASSKKIKDKKIEVIWTNV